MIHLRPKVSAQNEACATEGSIEDESAILEMIFTPQPNLCIRTTTTQRKLSAREMQVVGEKLRRLQRLLLEQYNTQTRVRDESAPAEPVAP